MNWGILGDSKASGCSLKNVHFWQRDVQIAPLRQQERLLASSALHAGNQAGKCSQKGKTAAGTYLLYSIVTGEPPYSLFLPLPHNHWVPPTFPVPASPPLFHASHCYRTRHVGKDAPTLMKVIDAQSWATVTAHLQSTLFVMSPKTKQVRGCPAWTLHYRAAVLWWGRVWVATTLLKFCFQHTSGMLGAKFFSLSP